MHIHYVDDDDLDALSLKQFVDASDEIIVSTSSSLDDAHQHNELGRADCVVLVIDRADAQSLEQDVLKVRQSTDAPIYFVTSGRAADYRERAIFAGAEAVFHKDKLTGEMLRQSLLNSRARQLVRNRQRKSFVKPLLSRAGDADNLRQLLANVAHFSNQLLASDSLLADDLEAMENLNDMIGALRQLARSDQCPEDDVPAASRLATIRRNASRLAASNDINLVFEISENCFEHFGDAAITELGLTHLLEGMIRSASKGDIVALYAYEHGSNISMVAMSNRAVIEEVVRLLKKKNPAPDGSTSAAFSLSLAAMLFGIEQPDINIIASGSVHRMVIRFG